MQRWKNVGIMSERKKVDDSDQKWDRFTLPDQHCNFDLPLEAWTCWEKIIDSAPTDTDYWFAGCDVQLPQNAGVYELGVRLPLGSKTVCLYLGSTKNLSTRIQAYISNGSHISNYLRFFLERKCIVLTRWAEVDVKAFNELYEKHKKEQKDNKKESKQETDPPLKPHKLIEDEYLKIVNYAINRNKNKKNNPKSPKDMWKQVLQQYLIEQLDNLALDKSIILLKAIISEVEEEKKEGKDKLISTTH